MKVGIITGSIREGRVNLGVAKWVKEVVEASGKVEVEIVDLKEYDLPMFAEPMSPAYTTELVESAKHAPWSAKIASLDAFIFVTPEYNHGIPSVLKNALDFLYNEWNNKAAGIVSYGSGGGIRSAEQLRVILSELQVAHVRTNPTFSLFTDFGEEGFKPAAEKIQKDTVLGMLDQLVLWGEAMNGVRAKLSK